MSRHWTLDELTDRLYGIRDEDEHLTSCRECSEQLKHLNLQRAANAAAPEIGPAVLAAQRAAVLDRAGLGGVRMPRWIPALTAVAAILAVAVFAHRPAPVAPPQDESAVTSDAQLFSDIYNIEESAEPLAAAPIHALFQEPKGSGQR